MQLGHNAFKRKSMNCNDATNSKKTGEQEGKSNSTADRRPNNSLHQDGSGGCTPGMEYHTDKIKLTAVLSSRGLQDGQGGTPPQCVLHNACCSKE